MYIKRFRYRSYGTVKILFGVSTNMPFLRNEFQSVQSLKQVYKYHNWQPKNTPFCVFCGSILPFCVFCGSILPFCVFCGSILPFCVFCGFKVLSGLAVRQMILLLLEDRTRANGLNPELSA